MVKYERVAKDQSEGKYSALLNVYDGSTNIEQVVLGDTVMEQTPSDFFLQPTILLFISFLICF
jgi:hypothetical protein